MSIRNALNSKAPKMSTTHNGTLTYASSTNPAVDMFFLFGASRGKDINSVFTKAFQYDPDLAVRIALWGRDIRGGAGERQQFRNFLNFLVTQATGNDVVDSLLIELIYSGKIHEVGRWDDYLEFVGTNYERFAFQKIFEGLSDSNTVGLVAKWMPRQGAIAFKLAEYAGLSPRNWRKRIVASTNVVEQKMCAKQWNSINFAQVPSLASARYQKAFNKNATEAYAEYKSKLVKGETKINANAVYPYDVLRSVEKGDQVVAQAQWDALPDYIGEAGNILPILDTSASMTWVKCAGSDMTPMDVGVSLALYIALKQKGEFNRILMNFSDESRIVELKTKTLREMANEIKRMNVGGSTNLQAAFTKLLSFAKRHRLPQSDMPRTILIMSDMEFNSCNGSYGRPRATNYDAIKSQYEAFGYKLPRIVFWNLNGRIGNSPVTSTEDGTALVSGFSPSIMKSILSGTDFSPEGIMRNTVCIDRYNFRERE